jgi:hypothetical protein
MLVRLTVKATGHMTTTPTLYSLRPVSDDRISIVVLFECSGHMTTAPALYSLRQVVSDDRIRPRSTKVSLISRRKSDAVKNNRGDLSVDNPAIFHDLCSTVTIEHLTLQLRCSTPLFNSSVQLLCSTPLFNSSTLLPTTFHHHHEQRTLLLSPHPLLLGGFFAQQQQQGLPPCRLLSLVANRHPPLGVRRQLLVARPCDLRGWRQRVFRHGLAFGQEQQQAFHDALKRNPHSQPFDSLSRSRLLNSAPSSVCRGFTPMFVDTHPTLSGRQRLPLREALLFGQEG